VVAMVYIRGFNHSVKQISQTPIVTREKTHPSTKFLIACPNMELWVTFSYLVLLSK